MGTMLPQPVGHQGLHLKVLPLGSNILHPDNLRLIHQLHNHLIPIPLPSLAVLPLQCLLHLHLRPLIHKIHRVIPQLEVHTLLMHTNKAIPPLSIHHLLIPTLARPRRELRRLVPPSLTLVMVSNLQTSSRQPSIFCVIMTCIYT